MCCEHLSPPYPRAATGKAIRCQAWLTRNLNRAGTLAGIAGSDLGDDPYFKDLYAKAARHRRKKAMGLAAGVPLLVLVALGVKLWGWQL